MSFNTLDPGIQHLAERCLNRKQLDVWKLVLAGNGRERIALMLGVHPSTVRGHLVAAHVKLERAGVKHGTDGNYYLEETAA